MDKNDGEWQKDQYKQINVSGQKTHLVFSIPHCYIRYSYYIYLLTRQVVYE